MITKTFLVVRKLSDNTEIHKVPVEHPYSTIRGTPKYQVIMSNMLRNMSDEYWIDDSEFDAKVNDEH